VNFFRESVGKSGFCGDIQGRATSNPKENWKMAKSLKTAWKAYCELKAKANKLLVDSDKLMAEGKMLIAKGNKLLTPSYELLGDGNTKWAEGNKLLAEGDKLKFEGNKLLAESRRLKALSDKKWKEAVVKVYGKVPIEWKDTGCRVKGVEYRYKK
jgi:hypothetical protein